MRKKKSSYKEAEHTIRAYHKGDTNPLPSVTPGSKMKHPTGAKGNPMNTHKMALKKKSARKKY